MTHEDPPTFEIGLGDLAGMMEAEAAADDSADAARSAAFIRQAMAGEAPEASHNDNDAAVAGDRSSVVLAFPTDAIARRLALRHSVTHHADGKPLSVEELSDALEAAVIAGGVDELVEVAFERACEDRELASIMLLHAVRLMDERALVDRAERLLGPRRYGPSNPPPVAA